jgi:hypothetical protein
MNLNKEIIQTDYLNYCIINNIKKFDDNNFKNFMIQYHKIIPFTLYKKLNIDKLNEYVILNFKT